MTRRQTLGVLLAAGLLLAGCSAGPSPATDSPSGSAPGSPSASDGATASSPPSPTLSAEEQQAVEEAAAVVLAYEQMFYDLLADPSRPLNDINQVVTDPQLDRDLLSLQTLAGDVSKGRSSIESTGPVTLVSISPIAVEISEDPPRVTLEVCVDKTAAAGSDNGQPWTGARAAMEYQLIRTNYLPEPGWAVSKILPPAGHEQPQPC